MSGYTTPFGYVNPVSNLESTQGDATSIRGKPINTAVTSVSSGEGLVYNGSSFTTTTNKIVEGPSNPTVDNSVCRFDGTGQNSIQDSGVVIDDSDNVTGINDLECNLFTLGDMTVGSGSTAGISHNGAREITIQSNYFGNTGKLVLESANPVCQFTSTQPSWDALWVGNGTLHTKYSNTGKMTVEDTSASTSTATGCAIFSGGVGVADDIYCGNTLYVDTINEETSANGIIIDGNVLKDTTIETNSISFDSGTTTLSHYSTATETLTWSGPLAATFTADIELTRVGRLVNCVIEDVVTLSADTTAYFQSSAISATYRPTGTFKQLIKITDNGTNAVGEISFLSGGIIRIYAGINSDNFAGSGTTGIESCSFSWYV